MNPELISLTTGARVDRASRFAPALSAGMAFYGIDTLARQAAFLAQIGHESGGLRYVAEVWGPTRQQLRYERNFDEPWPRDRDEVDLERFQANRLAFNLGNIKRGDGSLFRGHGLIQTTGRSNHARVRDRLRVRFPDVPDFEFEPAALMDTQWAALSACDYWDMRGLNAAADAGDFELVTRRINGGLTGLDDRLARFERAQRALTLA